MNRISFGEPTVHRLIIINGLSLMAMTCVTLFAEQPSKPVNEADRGTKEIKRLTEEIRRNPKDSMPHAQRGFSYLQANNPDLAITDFNNAMKIGNFPSGAHRAVALQMRATARFQKQQYRETLADLNEAVKLDPTCQAVYAMRGYLNYRAGDYKTAASDFEKAIEESPKDDGPKADYARLLACCPVDEFRDGEKAVTLATEACEMNDWKAAKCVAALSCAHAEKGDFELAISLLELAAETDPEMVMPLKQKFQMMLPHRDQPTLNTDGSARDTKTATANSPSAPTPPPPADDQSVLTTAEAANYVGKNVTVEMRIRSTGSNPAGFIELYSAPTWKEAGCFFVRFSEASQARFKKYNITDIGRQFRDTTVRVHGEIKMLRFLEIDHPVIYVEKLDQIEVVAGDVDYSTTPIDAQAKIPNANSNNATNPPSKSAPAPPKKR